VNELLHFGFEVFLCGFFRSRFPSTEENKQASLFGRLALSLCVCKIFSLHGEF
jgi:hypothetical protein